MTEAGAIPEAVLEAYGVLGTPYRPITIGLINRTYAFDHPALVLQRLHPVFSAGVNVDIDAITAHLERAGLPTPRIVRTRDGALWFSHEGHVWRALTRLPGRVHATFDAPLAGSAGALVGRFHRATADLEHTFQPGRVGVHDTARHLATLRTALTETGERVALVRAIGEAILEHAAALPDLGGLPTRIVHGDLKATNILFDDEDRASALLDLDTLAHGNLAHELGDALRSWCNARGESAAEVRFDADVFDAALRGWGAAMAPFVTSEERESLVLGTETICIELASRFAADVVHDRYFGWDSTLFPTRAAHNLARATSQLALSRSIRAQRPVLERLVRDALPTA